jgi:exopolysaccharide production protein ExoZ
MFLHFSLSSHVKIQPAWGNFGVDIFFVISGFIISSIANTEANRFFARRVIRIAPAYWAITVAWSCFLLITPSGMFGPTITVEYLLRSLLFFGSDPIVTRGWTLNYEMYFYAIFAICLLQSRIPSPILCAIVVVGLTLLFNVLASNSSVAVFYGDPIIIEFVFGIIAYYIWLRLPVYQGRKRTAWLASIGLALVVGTVWWMATAETLGLQPRAVFIGIPAFICVLGALWMERSANWKLTSPFGQLLGDSAYMVYLIHPFVLGPLNRFIWPMAYQYTFVVRCLFFCVAVALTLVLSCFMHLYFELPTIEFLKRRLRKNSKIPIVRASPQG